MPDEPVRYLAPLSPWGKVRLVARLLTAYGRVRITLRRSPLPQALAHLRREPPVERPSDRHALLRAERMARAVDRTIELLPTDSRCLMRSLVLVSVLARDGIHTSLVIGVVPHEDKFEPHAWVELAGRELLTAGSARTQRLHEL